MAKVDLPDLPNNSKSARDRTEKPDERHAAAVGKGKARRSIGKDIVRAFIMEDPKDVAEEIWETEVVPGIKAAATNAFNMFVYGIGGAPAGTAKRKKYTESRVSYDKYYSDRDNERGSDRRNDSGRSRRSARDFDDIEFEDLGEAKDVLQGLFDEAVQYGQVTVSYYYELAGMTEDMPYTAAKYGWRKEMLEGVKAERLYGGGYVLSLPKPVAL